MSVSAFPFGQPGDDDSGILPHSVASPRGVDPIFPIREEWLRATTDASDKTRLRDWLDREVLRLHPDTMSNKESSRLRKQRERVLEALPKARRDEEDALSLEDTLTERVLATSPETIPGFVAKLQFLLRYGAPGPDCREFPWPELETLLHDLQRLTGTEWVLFDP